MKGRDTLLRQPPKTRSPSSMPPLFAKAAPLAMLAAGDGGAGTITGARRAPYRTVGFRRGL